MSRIRGKDTKPETLVRKLLHGLGYRFRLHRRDLPGKPDIVLAGRRKAILIHGCFWHAHGCKIGQPPKSRPEFWGPKLERNKARDAEVESALRTGGWEVLVVWQCETRDLSNLRHRLVEFLGPTTFKNTIDTESRAR